MLLIDKKLLVEIRHKQFPKYTLRLECTWIVVISVWNSSRGESDIYFWCVAHLGKNAYVELNMGEKWSRKREREMKKLFLFAVTSLKMVTFLSDKFQKYNNNKTFAFGLFQLIWNRTRAEFTVYLQPMISVVIFMFFFCAQRSRREEKSQIHLIKYSIGILLIRIYTICMV